MASRELCGSSSVTGLPRNEKLPCASEVLESLWIPKPSSVLYGSKSLINFSENVGGGDTSGTPYFQSLDKEENGYEDFDGCLNPPGKKRRLTASQVQFLEKNFEVENKLEPERKVQLAQQLGLQPRQVAIWFQNRRARFKNQRLEKDYDDLKAVYDKLKVDYDNLLKEKQVLNDQVVSLKDNLLLKEEEKGNLEILDSIKSLEAEEPRKPIMDGDTKTLSIPPMVVCKQEDASSVKSDVFDSDSSHYTDGNHSPLIEPADCSQVFEQEQSDFSQDEEDNPNYNMNLVPPPPCLLKLEEDCYYDTPPTNSCNFGFSVDDHPFWSWSY